MAYFKPYVDATGIHVPSFTDIQDNLVSSAKSIFGQDIYLENDSQDMQYISTVSRAISDCFDGIVLASNNQAPQTAIGSALDTLGKLNGLQRLPATYSTVQITCIGEPNTVIPAGVVKDTSGYMWDLPANCTIQQNGILSVTATCETVGAVLADIGTIQTIVTTQYGWYSVSNAAAATPGVALETDTGLRKRQSESVLLPSQTPLDGTTAAIQTISGVTRRKVYENDTASTDANGIPAHSVAAVVEGGDDTEVATAIANKKTMGCGTYGTTSITMPSQYSVGSAIKFSRPTESPIDVIVTILQLTSEYTQAVQNSMISNITSYLNGIDIGTAVQASSLYYPALSAMASQTGPSFSVLSLVINKEGTNSATVTTQTSGSTSLVISSTSGLSVGMTVVGTGIPAGTTILAINSGTSTVTMSQTATSSASSGTVTFYTTSAPIAWNEVAKVGTITVIGGY